MDSHISVTHLIPAGAKWPGDFPCLPRPWIPEGPHQLLIRPGTTGTVAPGDGEDYGREKMGKISSRKYKDQDLKRDGKSRRQEDERIPVSSKAKDFFPFTFGKRRLWGGGYVEPGLGKNPGKNVGPKFGPKIILHGTSQTKSPRYSRKSYQHMGTTS